MEKMISNGDTAKALQIQQFEKSSLAFIEEVWLQDIYKNKPKPPCYWQLFHRANLPIEAWM